RHAGDSEPLAVGFVNQLPANVGGGTVHWDAKTPRFWDIDFKKRSLLGPVDGADVEDWPLSYGDLAPFYDEVEALIGVQGDLTGLVELRANTFVYDVSLTGRRARSVSFIDPTGTTGREACDLVVLAGSAIETARLALLAGLPSPSGLVGRHLMFHWFTDAFGV